MGGSVNFPADREGSSTTGAVAELLNAFTFPTIVPLGTDMAALADLPELPIPEESGPCRLAGIRTLMDGTATTLSAVARHQNQAAALTAVLVERMVATLEAEDTVLELDLWQRETGRAGLRAEIAVLLNIPEGLATALMINSVTLIRHLPTTMAQLSAGVLGWGHAVIIAEETTLLRQAGLPQDVIDGFEQVLLGKAEHATLQSFREKARRARERMYPETLAPRSRRAYENRRIGISRSRDGMSWFNLYGPSPTIEAIWIQCTATAQAAQGPPREPDPHPTTSRYRRRPPAVPNTRGEQHPHTSTRTLTSTCTGQRGPQPGWLGRSRWSRWAGDMVQPGRAGAGSLPRWWLPGPGYPRPVLPLLATPHLR